MSASTEKIELQLDSFNHSERKDALYTLQDSVESGDIKISQTGTDVNLHFHTFYSYNACGYSPSRIAWLAYKTGLDVTGIVDFDVLDGLEEFLEAAKLLGLKGCVGMETRVYVPEFTDKVMNSPGEPGISYHMGVGFPDTKLQASSPSVHRTPRSPLGSARAPRAAGGVPRTATGNQQKFLLGLCQTAQQRNRDLTERVNKYLSPVELDYERDVWPLTPCGNATERHICLAYAKKARSIFTDDSELEKFWAYKLQTEPASLQLPKGLALLNRIRAKTMKRGGIGYVQPDAGTFPKMEETNRFILAAGAIPTLTWLDGTSDGEKEIEKLLEVGMNTGVAAINIIPARNYTPGIKDEKLANLHRVVKLAEKLNLPIVVGTEMNSPGQKFVDDFNSAELAPLLPVFLKGAYIVYAHSALQRQSSLGYTSQWARENFQTISARNGFFQKLGKLLQPYQQELLGGLHQSITPRQILDKIKSANGET